jgi:hypothetical protein
MTSARLILRRISMTTDIKNGLDVRVPSADKRQKHTTVGIR